MIETIETGDDQSRLHQLTLLAGIDILFGLALAYFSVSGSGPLTLAARVVNVVLYQGFTIFVLAMIVRQKNWARRLYVALCIPTLAFAPPLMFPAFPQMKLLLSPSHPEVAWSVFYMNILFTIGFVGFLFSDRTRRLFTVERPSTVLRAFGLVTASMLLILGIFINASIHTVASYVAFEGTRVTLTERGRGRFGPYMEKERKKAEALLGMGLPPTRFVFANDKSGAAASVLMPETDYRDWLVACLVVVPDAGKVGAMKAWNDAMKTNPKWRSQLPLSTAEASVDWDGRSVPATRYLFGERERNFDVISFVVPGKNIYVFIGQKKYDDERVRRLIDDLAKAQPEKVV